ncbi:MAG TPA: thioredoxin domain-containing protein [Sphingomicrobium sp.]
MGFAIAVAAAALTPAGAAPRPAVDWSRTVALQPSGGFRMGNPKARVKLVEFGSMTCPHCRYFDEDGAGPLIARYVKTGKVSWEFRNYVRDAYDLSASLIARCNGAKSFFSLTRALFRDQDKWIATARSAPDERRNALKELPQNRLFLEAARVAGLQRWAAARGLPVARSSQCLTNTRSVDGLVAMTAAANEQYPDFAGTPSFLVNGRMLASTATWDALEPQLRAALGEHG